MPATPRGRRHRSTSSLLTHPSPSACPPTQTRLRRRGALICATLLSLLTMFLVAPAAQAALPASVRLRVLVVDDGSPMVAAVAAALTSQGQPWTRIDLGAGGRQTITASFLGSSTSSTVTGNFSGVVLPNGAPDGLDPAELALLRAYERTFKVREYLAYVYPGVDVGLGGHLYSGPADGLTADLTPAALAGPFGYLRGQLKFDDRDPAVAESWAVPGVVPAPGSDGSWFESYLNLPGVGQGGTLLGVFHQADGREQLVSTLASNQYQQHFGVLSPGIISWLTRGISLTQHRNYFSVQVDDVFMEDALWSIEGNCTIGDGCDPTQYPEDAPGATVRMTAPDVAAVVAFQQQNGFAFSMAYNGAGVAEYKADNGNRDPLYTAFLANRAKFSWINHTYTHSYLGCVQNFTVSPWACAVTVNGATRWVSRSTIINEIARNLVFSTGLGSTRESGALVTGEHSGLKSLPQMSVDNPNLASALTLTGVRWIASDASRETMPRTIGSATTVPRHPMNIFYNTATKQQAVSEYNWIYTSAANGGSGICEVTPGTTCIQPLSLDTGFDSYIVPLEATIAMGHVLGNDPRPHYAHQSNITGDFLLLPVVSSVLTQYRQVFADNTPLVVPGLGEAGRELVRQQTWAQRQSLIVATVSGSTLSLRSTGATVQTPVTLPATATVGASYGGQRSALISVGASTRTVGLGGPSGFATTATWPETPGTTVIAPAPTKDAPRGTVVIRLVQAKSAQIEKANQ